MQIKPLVLQPSP